MYVIVTNNVNKGEFAVGQGNNRENTGNLQMQFEWVPCLKETKTIVHILIRYFKMMKGVFSLAAGI